MTTLTDEQLTRLEHRAQGSAGSEMPIAPQAVMDMVAEIRNLRAALAAVPWVAIHRVHMAANYDPTDLDYWIAVADWMHNNMPEAQP